MLDRMCTGWQRQLYLEDFANAACDVLAIRAEARYTDRALEAEVMQQHPAPLVDEQGAPIHVNSQEQAPIWAQTQRAYLPVTSTYQPRDPT